MEAVEEMATLNTKRASDRSRQRLRGVIGAFPRWSGAPSCCASRYWLREILAPWKQGVVAQAQVRATVQGMETAAEMAEVRLGEGREISLLW